MTKSLATRFSAVLLATGLALSVAGAVTVASAQSAPPAATSGTPTDTVSPDSDNPCC
ncbi:hypothetical protein [Kitasatospora sp. LaBMicrA B282]|uniref:hypothetical protein n=1 Tax=Kitasatospora sp. LaBMicrA B282 TaxID=3420949 RepID=UPI003D0DB7BC